MLVSKKYAWYPSMRNLMPILTSRSENHRLILYLRMFVDWIVTVQVIQRSLWMQWREFPPLQFDYAHGNIPYIQKTNNDKINDITQLILTFGQESYQIQVNYDM
jgi:hypothetical protein